jgi:hypothetical protein
MLVCIPTAELLGLHPYPCSFVLKWTYGLPNCTATIAGNWNTALLGSCIMLWWLFNLFCAIKNSVPVGGFQLLPWSRVMSFVETGQLVVL